MSKLTGGDWERRANEYWTNWHRSARIAGEQQYRAEDAERTIKRVRDALRRFFDGDVMWADDEQTSAAYDELETFVEEMVADA